MRCLVALIADIHPEMLLHAESLEIILDALSMLEPNVHTAVRMVGYFWKQGVTHPTQSFLLDIAVRSASSALGSKKHNPCNFRQPTLHSA